jgi:formyltetrahydrofolate hydrolase
VDVLLTHKSTISKVTIPAVVGNFESKKPCMNQYKRQYIIIVAGNYTESNQSKLIAENEKLKADLL